MSSPYVGQLLLVAKYHYFTCLLYCSGHGDLVAPYREFYIVKDQVKQTAKLKTVAFEGTRVVELKLALAKLLYCQLPSPYYTISVNVFASEKSDLLLPIEILNVVAEVT